MPHPPLRVDAGRKRLSVVADELSNSGFELSQLTIQEENSLLITQEESSLAPTTVLHHSERSMPCDVKQPPLQSYPSVHANGAASGEFVVILHQLESLHAQLNLNTLMTKAMYKTARSKKKTGIAHVGSSRTDATNLEMMYQKSLQQSLNSRTASTPGSKRTTIQTSMESSSNPQKGPAIADMRPQGLLHAPDSCAAGAYNSGAVSADLHGKFKEWAEAQEPGSEASKPMSRLTQFVKEHTKVTPLMSAWRFLEDKTSSRAACVYYYLRELFLFFAIVFACVDLTDFESSTSTLNDRVVESIEVGVESVFAAELILRMISSPHRKAFCLNFYNIIDFISACPLVLRLTIRCANGDWMNSNEVTSLLGVVPVFRLLKVLRHFETFQLLLHAFVQSVSVLPVLIFTLLLLSLTFAALIFYYEPRDNIPTIPMSLYFVLVTLTTVGYGDISPTSLGGRFFTVMLIVLGTLYMAIPLGIVGKAFSDAWEQRHHLLLISRLRGCVERSGYTRGDFETVFALFDENGDGALDLTEFTFLLKMMNVKTDEKLVKVVFESFDIDDMNCVSQHELVLGLFPHAAWLRN